MLITLDNELCLNVLEKERKGGIEISKLHVAFLYM